MECPKCHGSNFGFARRCDHCGADLAPPRRSATDSAPVVVEDTSPDKPAILLKLADGRLIRACPMKFVPRPSRDTSVLSEPIGLALTHLVDAGVPRDEAMKYLPILVRRSVSLPTKLVD